MTAVKKTDEQEIETVSSVRVSEAMRRSFEEAKKTFNSQPIGIQKQLSGYFAVSKDQ